jgi:hypothetical protein
MNKKVKIIIVILLFLAILSFLYILNYKNGYIELDWLPFKEEYSSINEEFDGDFPENLQQCSNIDSILNQLLTSENPLTFAESRELKIVDGRVKVELSLVNEEITLSTNLDFIENIRSGNTVQGFVRIDQLCELANTAEVAYIRVPSYAETEDQTSENNFDISKLTSMSCEELEKLYEDNYRQIDYSCNSNFDCEPYHIGVMKCNNMDCISTSSNNKLLAPYIDELEKEMTENDCKYKKDELLCSLPPSPQKLECGCEESVCKWTVVSPE